MKKRRLNVVLCFAALVAVAIFGFALYKVFTIKTQQTLEQNAFNELAAIVQKHRAENSEASPAPALETSSPLRPSSDPSSEPQILPELEELKNLNSDLFGWLRIDGTPIDYPVMYTPQDSEYYLRRAFDGSSSSSGTLFVDGNCAPNGSFYLIYGHKMKNKTMFGALNYYSELEYREKHPIIRFDTLYERREYEVIAAFYGTAGDASDSAFRYHLYTDLSDPAVFAEYVSKIRQAALYDTGFSVEYGDELIALSTCSYHTDDGRFVVVAKRVK